jgi:type I restriction enzyme M protein
MKLTQQQLEAHLLGAANILRGRTAGQDYKNYILSLMFYKRLCDQWEREADDAIAELEAQQGKIFTEAQRSVFRARGEHRFTIPKGAHWEDVKLASTDIGAVLTRATRAVADSNDELRGVFTVDWNQPAPDGSGKPLIPNEVVHALFQHFDEHSLSNAAVTPDVLGRAYEYLIKHFADDAGAKAGEFFTPPEVVDVLVRILRPHPGDTIYDPTSGSGGMLVHCADYLREDGHHVTSARYFGQEMNWGNAAISKINSVLHGLDADIKAGASAITDPQFVNDQGGVRAFSLALANFPFSDEMWWLRPEQQTDDKKKKAKLRNEIFGSEGYKDPYGRFGRGVAFPSPPANYGDYAFILHILASLTPDGRAGIVCPQGVLFRGQPEVDPEEDGPNGRATNSVRKRKADNEYLIRRSLLDARLLDAVISLPLNVFYGATVPACLLILRKVRPPERRDSVLMVYAARDYRELAAQNALRPQDVMRILVHYHAYGDAARVPPLLAEHGARIAAQIDERESDEVGIVVAEYEAHETKRTDLVEQLALAEQQADHAITPADKNQQLALIAKLTKQRATVDAKLLERDARLADIRRLAQEDREDISTVASELNAMYSDPQLLGKHARVVPLSEVEENDYNLNVPRYVDTFEPEPRVAVPDAMRALAEADRRLSNAQAVLNGLMNDIGYAD